jgi:hypothetical protein
MLSGLAGVNAIMRANSSGVRPKTIMSGREVAAPKSAWDLAGADGKADIGPEVRDVSVGEGQGSRSPWCV